MGKFHKDITRIEYNVLLDQLSCPQKVLINLYSEMLLATFIGYYFVDKQIVELIDNQTAIDVNQLISFLSNNDKTS